jgi:hypothetical protein
MTHALIAQLWTAALLVASFSSALRAQTSSAKPVHGAFADGSRWERVIPILQCDGYRDSRHVDEHLGGRHSIRHGFGGVRSSRSDTH